MASISGRPISDGAARLAPLAARAAGSVGLALGAWGCLRAFSIVAAVFVFCTALMLFFSLIPYLGALAASRRSDRHDAR